MATVGGRTFDYTRNQVEQAMRDVEPELIQKHVVEMLETVYPPKQVLATVTGWERTTFTTAEAQRVLSRLGFTCREAKPDDKGKMAWVKHEEPPIEARVARLESALAVAHEAITGLSARVAKLEVGHNR